MITMFLGKACCVNCVINYFCKVFVQATLSCLSREGMFCRFCKVFLCDKLIL